MKLVCWLALNPRRAIPLLAVMAVPAVVLAFKKVVRR